MKNSAQPISLHYLAYTLSLANDMDTLVVTLRNPHTNTLILKTAVKIPPQVYKRWTERDINGYEYEKREYISGGFKDGKLADYFQEQVIDIVLLQLAGKYPDAIQPDREEIKAALDNFS